MAKKPMLVPKKNKMAGGGTAGDPKYPDLKKGDPLPEGAVEGSGGMSGDNVGRRVDEKGNVIGFWHIPAKTEPTGQSTTQATGDQKEAPSTIPRRDQIEKPMVVQQMPVTPTVETPEQKRAKFNQAISDWTKQTGGSASAQKVPSAIADYIQNTTRPAIMQAQEQLNIAMQKKYGKDYDPTKQGAIDKNQALNEAEATKVLGKQGYADFQKHMEDYNKYRQATLGTYSTQAETQGKTDVSPTGVGKYYGARERHLFENTPEQSQYNTKLTPQNVLDWQRNPDMAALQKAAEVKAQQQGVKLEGYDNRAIPTPPVGPDGKPIIPEKSKEVPIGFAKGGYNKLLKKGKKKMADGGLFSPDQLPADIKAKYDTLPPDQQAQFLQMYSKQVGSSGMPSNSALGGTAANQSANPMNALASIAPMAGQMGANAVNSINLKSDNVAQNEAKSAGALALRDAGKGASMGATLGSIVPGVGTALGAGIGAGAGALFGGIQGFSQGKKKADAASSQLEQNAIANARQYKADGGKIVGKGTGKSDDIPAEIQKGSFIVPAENEKVAQLLRETYLSKSGGKAKLKQGGNTSDVWLSNGEHLFTPDEVSTLKKNGVDVDALAPNAKDTGHGYQDGGHVSSAKAKTILKDGTIRGHALTDKQKRYFGWIAGGMKADGGALEYNKGGDVKMSFDEFMEEHKHLLKVLKNKDPQELDAEHESQKEEVNEVKSGQGDSDDSKAEGGGIGKIAESKKGTFTAAAKRHGQGVQEFAATVMANKDDYSPEMVKKANFARNAAEWSHKNNGGEVTNVDELYYNYSSKMDDGANNGYKAGGYSDGGNVKDMTDEEVAREILQTEKLKKSIPDTDPRNRQYDAHIQDLRNEINYRKDIRTNPTDFHVANKMAISPPTPQQLGKVHSPQSIETGATQTTPEPTTHAPTSQQGAGTSPQGTAMKERAAVDPQAYAAIQQAFLKEHGGIAPEKAAVPVSDTQQQNQAAITGTPTTESTPKPFDQSVFDAMVNKDAGTTDQPQAAAPQTAVQNVFDNLGGVGGLLAVAQLGTGIAMGAGKKPPKYAVDPGLLQRQQQAIQQEKFGFSPQEMSTATQQIQNQGANVFNQIADVSGGDVGLNVANARLSALDTSNAFMNLAAENERVRQSKVARADDLTAAVAQQRRMVFEDTQNMYMRNQQASMDLAGAGLANLFGAIQSQKNQAAIDARAAKYGNVLDFSKFGQQQSTTNP